MQPSDNNTSNPEPAVEAATQRPRLGLSPNNPAADAGMRIDPPPSLACANGTMPAASSLSCHILSEQARAERAALARIGDEILEQKRHARERAPSGPRRRNLCGRQDQWYRALSQHELVRFLEQTGLVMGADSNAQTTYHSTSYVLELPADDSATLDRAVLILAPTNCRIGNVPSERAYGRRWVGSRHVEGRSS